MRAHSYDPRKLDLHPKNKPSPPTKLGIEVPLLLKLKQLPNNLSYVFLGTKNTLLLILAANLNYEKVQDVIKVFISYKIDIGWTIADIIKIPPGICTHNIQFEED